MRVEQLTCAIGAELSGVNLADASHDDGLFAEICAGCCSSTRCCSCATRTSPAPSTWPSRAASASWRIIRWPAAIRSIRAWCASTSRRTSPTTATRTPGTATPPGARRRRWAACCAASNARRSAATPCGPTWRWPTRSCPEHIKEQIAGLRARHSIEATLRRGHADREAPGAEGAVSRTPSTRWCARIRRPARRSCSSTPSPRTSPTSTRPSNVRYRPGRTTRARSELLQLPDQPGATSPSTRCAGAGSRTASPSGTTAAPSTTPSWTTRPAIARWSAPGSSATCRTDPTRLIHRHTSSTTVHSQREP